MAAPLKSCSVEGCNSPIRGRSMCNAHYRRWLRYGDATQGRTARGDLPKFLDEAVGYSGDDCLKWPYGHNGNGYGVIQLDGTHQLVHRIVCERVHGAPETPDLEAAHTCGRGRDGCCNPRHLAWKTTVENEADKAIHGTVARGSRQGSSKLTEGDVLAIKASQASLSAERAGRRYGVSPFTIYKIRRGDRWGWLSEEEGAAT